MSFVHCPSCSRAYDLRRGASCPRCAASAKPSQPAQLEHAPASAISAPATSPATSVGVADPRLASADLPLEERIVAMVAELARVVEQASTAELAAAQRLLSERKLPGLGAGRLLGLPERAAEALHHHLGKVTAQVTRAIERPRRSATRLMRGLRSALGAP